MEKALLLYSKMQVDSRFAGAVAETCKLHFLPVTDLGPFQTALNTHETPLIFVEVLTPADCAELARIFAGKVDRNRVHLIISLDSLKSFQGVAPFEIAGSVIVRKDGDVERAGRHYARICRAVLEKQTSNFEQFFEKDTPVQTVNIPRKLDRGIASNALVNFLEKLGVNHRIASLVAGAVHELLMQATPMPDTTVMGSVFEQFSPESSVLKDMGFTLQLRIAADQRYIGISLRRPLCGLQRSELLKYFTKNDSGNVSEESGNSQSQAQFAMSVISRSGGSLFVIEGQSDCEIFLFYEAWEKIRDFKQQFQFVSTWK